jgi:prepilin-type N-terminal cleavage/methylation domain-containing protein
MNNMFNKGFTLIEIIIVIVIIGVLATLALPRITGQIEASRGAEAMNMFGAIRRSAINCVDMSNISGNAAGARVAAARCLRWVELGMSEPVGAQFTYTSGEIAPVGSGIMQFRAIRPMGVVCMNIDAATAQGTFSLAPNDATNPFYGAVMRTGTTGGAACDVVPLTAMAP